MFFSIAKTRLNNYPSSQKIHNFYFNCDLGWEFVVDTDAIYAFKGYATDNFLENIVKLKLYENKLKGNFCIIKFTSNNVNIFSNYIRPFPLYLSDNELTNFIEDKHYSRQLWANELVALDSNFNLTSAREKIDLTVIKTDNIATAVDKIKTLLIQNEKHTADYFDDKPVITFRTGGLDTGLVCALINYLKVDAELTVDDVFEEDTGFVKNNLGSLRKLWGYNQLHNWQESRVIVTGSHGDEYFLRGPKLIATHCAWHDVNFLELLEKNTNCYHYHYFKRDKNLKIFKEAWENRHYLKKKFPHKLLLTAHLINENANDYQHWHLDNTISWTPLKDLDITRILLGLDIEELIPQFLDGAISKQLITELSNGTITVDPYKNTKQ